MTPFLSCCMIVRDAAKTIDALLDSIDGAFDEIVIVDTGSTDGTRERIAERIVGPGWMKTGFVWPAAGADPFVGFRYYNGPDHPTRVVLASFDWIDDFAAAREFSFSLATGKWRGYLDADDTFPLAKRLRATIERTEKDSPQTNCIALPYDYAGGEMMQDKYRFVRWADGWKWQGAIHEYLVRSPPGPRMISRYVDLVVVHNHSDEHTQASLDRNMRICRAVRRKAQDEGDTYTAGLMAFYLGQYAIALGSESRDTGRGYLIEAARELRGRNLGLDALCRLARLDLEAGNALDGLYFAGQAIAEYPEAQDAHLTHGLVLADSGQTDRAAIVFDRAFALPRAQIESARDTVIYDALIPVVAARTYLAVGRVDDGWKRLQTVPHDLRLNPRIARVFLDAQRDFFRRFGLDRIRALVEFYLWDTEPLKARRFLQENVPAAIADSLEVKAMIREIEAKLPHMEGFSAYCETYASIPAETYHTAPEHRENTLRLGRTRRMVEWAKSLGDEGPRVDLLAIGAQDCIIEGEILAASKRVRITVCDVAPQASRGITELRARFPDRVETHTIKSHAYDWAPSDHMFDAITIFEVLEHLPNDGRAIVEIRQLLRPDGTLFLSTPVADRWVEPYLTDPKTAPKWYGHVRAHNPNSLWDLFRRNGFTGSLDATDLGGVFFAKMRRAPPRLTNIGIYVPSTPSPFDPDSPKRGHVGGSEEAVIYLSRALANRGVDVTVYAPRLAREDDTTIFVRDGVRWKDASEFDAAGSDHAAVLFWRCPAVMLDPAVRSARYAKLLWLHDASYGAPREAYEAADGVIVLSGFHRKILTASDDLSAADVRWHFAANGIVAEDFVPTAPPPDGILCRDPLRVIYASSPDRGLDQLLDAWPLVRAQIPDARLDVTYTWDLLEAAMDRGPDLARRFGGLRRRVESMHDLGVASYGGVDHSTLAAMFRRAAVWAYPCRGRFEVEISCITAMKAQAAGCWPVYTEEGALDETVIDGLNVAGPFDCRTFAAAIVAALTHGAPSDDQRIALAEEARRRFSWENAAARFTEIVKATTW